MSDIQGILAKVIINASMEIKTGLHIGASSAFSAIGAIDMPVVRNGFNNEPYIPGSSLKGKMRYLLARIYARDGFVGKIDQDDSEIKRLFGSSVQGDRFTSRLQFFDIFFNEKSVDMMKRVNTGLYLSEAKYENTIDRLTAEANPRQIERVPAGSIFDFKLVYNVENLEEMDKDIENIKGMLELLEDDYLGGHGTRGYGRVAFKDIGYKVKSYRSNEKQEEIQDIMQKHFSVEGE